MKSEKEKILRGNLYNAFGLELSQERERAYQLFSELNALGKSKPERKTEILNILLEHCGSDVCIEPPFYCDYGSHIHIENNVFINFNCTILDAAQVRIGAHTLIGPNVQIYSATHPTNWKLRAQDLENAKPITIGENCWIGGASVICPGVTIGNRSVIGAGSVVTKSIPNDVVAVGNPCRVIKTLNP
ncbi:MAG: maltose acetyltransferase [Bacteroidetes bacterium MedPE-SWsnd-G2]|nr:MAG: maltose acetyltransferase [Bacteroidetes bacterium MedPE-SWsnd-G2]